MHLFFIGLVIGLVVGGFLSYMFRNQEEKIISAAETDAQSVASKVSKKL